jgi:hypothetical protein
MHYANKTQTSLVLKDVMHIVTIGVLMGYYESIWVCK